MKQNTTLKMEFFKSDGSPMNVSIPGMGKKAVFDLNLKVGQVRQFMTSGTSSLQVGFVRLTTSSEIAAAAVLSCSNNGIGQFEAGVPAVKGQKEFTIYVDSDAVSKGTGLAFVNVGPAQAKVTFRLYDQTFNLRATRTLEEVKGSVFKKSNHLAIYASEIFDNIVPEILTNGVITVESDRQLAATTLHQFFPADVFVLTAYPVMSGIEDQ